MYSWWRTNGCSRSIADSIRRQVIAVDVAYDGDATLAFGVADRPLGLIPYPTGNRGRAFDVYI